MQYIAQQCDKLATKIPGVGGILRSYFRGSNCVASEHFDVLGTKWHNRTLWYHAMTSVTHSNIQDAIAR